jgi:hypothetical protein
MNIVTLLAAPRELRIESIVVTTTGIRMTATTAKAQADAQKRRATDA